MSSASSIKSTKSDRQQSIASIPDEEKDIGQSGRAPSTNKQESHTNNAGEQEQKVVDDWDGPDDPANPHNWPLWQRIYHTCVVSLIALNCSFGSSIITPGRDDLMRDLGVSSEVALLPYALYVVGLAFGPLISAPCSETLGRRMVYRIGTPLFALFTLGAGFSQSIVSVLICRFLAGIFASPGLAIGSATITDIWPRVQRALPMTLYVATPFLGPSIGPLVGGVVTGRRGWRWTQWALLLLTAACLAPSLLMKETYKSTIVRHRAKKRGLQYPKSEWTPVESAKYFLVHTLDRPIHMFLVEPVVASFTSYVGINFGMLFAFFAAFPYVFEQNYGFGLTSVGLTFLGQAVGTVIGCVIIVVYQMRYKRKVAWSIKNGNGGKIPPEERLLLAMIGSIMLPVSLFWFGWSAHYRVHWMSPVMAEAMFSCGNELVFMSCVMYVMDFYGPLYGASAQATNSLVRYCLGAAFPLFIVQMYEALGIGWATSLLGFISLGLTTIPWLLYVYGAKLRQKSKFVKQAPVLA